jgi:hypothetical protein
MAESERVLRNEEKYKELIDLYQSKKEHKKGTYMYTVEGEGGKKGEEEEEEEKRERERPPHMYMHVYYSTRDTHV